MKALLKIELQKAFRSKLFFVALTIGCLLAVATFVLNYQLSQRIVEDIFPYLDTKFLDASVDSCYRFWIVTDTNQPTSYLFFLLVPLLAALPYSWSYAQESALGYTRQMRTRSSQGEYLASKLVAASLSGAVAVTAPLMLSLVLSACFVPARLPDIGSVIYFGVYEESLWSNLFYSQPLLYCSLYTLLVFLFSGIWAATVFSLSMLSKNRVALIVASYLFWLGVKFVSDNVLIGIVRTELTPFGFLRASGYLYTPNGWVIVVVLALCAAVAILLTFSARKRDVL